MAYPFKDCRDFRKACEKAVEGALSAGIVTRYSTDREVNDAFENIIKYGLTEHDCMIVGMDFERQVEGLGYVLPALKGEDR